MLNIPLLDTQRIALQHLNDGIKEVMFGGGGRGGKTQLGSFWMLENIFKYPKSHQLIARSSLTDLYRTSLTTFKKVAFEFYNLAEGTNYNHNQRHNVITFENGSLIYLSELKYRPRDSEYNFLGSYDLTFAWIDECQEIPEKAKDMIQTRMTFKSLYKKGSNELVWKAKPSVLYTCNPLKNWVFYDFWEPIIKNKTNIENKRFVTSLYKSNIFIDREDYRNRVLSTENKVLIKRLLDGDFEYELGDDVLFEFEDLLELFRYSNDDLVAARNSRDRYISVDVAGMGKDKTVIFLWYGDYIMKCWTFDRNRQDDLLDFVRDIAKEENVHVTNIVVDENGIGGGLVDHLRCVGFISNSKQIKDENNKNAITNYQNLRSQCFFELSKKIKSKEIKICLENKEIRDIILKDLQSIKQSMKSEKLSIISKDEIKLSLGKSPDFADAIMIKMIYSFLKRFSENIFYSEKIKPNIYF